MPNDVTEAYNAVWKTVKNHDLDEIGLNPIYWHAEQKDYGVVAYIQDDLGGDGRQVAGIYNSEEDRFERSGEYFGDRTLNGTGEIEDSSDLRSLVNQELDSS